MLRAWRAFDSLRGADVKPWLLTIVRNCFLTAAGRVKRGPDAPLPDDSEIALTDRALIAQEDPEDAVMQQDSHRQLVDLLAVLPSHFREVLVLRELEELSYSQIAQITGAPVGTVMSRLARARALLKENWRRSEEGSPHVVQ